MKLLDFLSEKAMNMATFSDTEKRLGGTALVGFEFEVAVDSDSPYYVEDVDDRETQVISDFDSLDEFRNFFYAPTSTWRSIKSDYESWKEESKFNFIDDEWKNYLDEENGIGEDEAREEAEKEWEERLAHKFEFGDWLRDEFGKERIDFAYRYDLEPKYGWYSEDGQNAAIYTEEKDDDYVTRNTAEKLAVGLRNVVDADVEVHKEYHEGKKSLSKWYIEPDSSIKNGVGLEIVSPPQKLSKALSDMEDVCEWIASDDGLNTNVSTGLHVNVSIPGIDANLDPVKLVLFMGERYSLELFNRLGNTYAVPHLKQLLTKVKASGRFPRGFEQMQKAAMKYLSSDKYYSVNLGHLTDGYVEFRAAGGAGYERDIERLKKIVLRFVTAVEIACNPAAERQEYVKKLVKIFNTAFDLGDISTERESSLVPGELNRLAKLQPSIKDELRVIRDSRNAQDRRNSLIAAMAMVIPAVRNIGSELSIKELAYLKRMAKELEVKPSDVDLYYSDKTDEPTDARKDFKNIYRI